MSTEGALLAAGVGALEPLQQAAALRSRALDAVLVVANESVTSSSVWLWARTVASAAR